MNKSKGLNLINQVENLKGQAAWFENSAREWEIYASNPTGPMDSSEARRIAQDCRDDARRLRDRAAALTATEGSGRAPVAIRVKAIIRRHLGADSYPRWP